MEGNGTAAHFTTCRQVLVETEDCCCEVVISGFLLVKVCVSAFQFETHLPYAEHT